MKTEQLALLLGVIAIIVAFAGLGIAGQTMINVNKMQVGEHTHPEPEPAEPDERVGDLMEFWSGQSDYNKQVDQTLIDLRTDVAILKARGDVTTQPRGTTSGTGSIDLDLRTQDNKGQIKSKFSRDTPVILITGESTFEKKDFRITIEAPSGKFVKDRIVVTYSNGDLSEAWIVPDDAEIGTYEVEITINAQKDSVEFTLT